MKLIHIALAATALVSAPAFASKDLANKSACMGCHAVDRKMVGPSFQDVAKKNAGVSADALAANIKKGSAGKYGPVPMPAQAALSDADAKTLAAWILAGAK